MVESYDHMSGDELDVKDHPASNISPKDPVEDSRRYRSYTIPGERERQGGPRDR